MALAERITDPALVTPEFLRERFDWSHTREDAREQIVRFVADNAKIIMACCGPFRANTVIVWFQYDPYLSVANITLRCGLGDVDDDESVLAVPIC